MGSSRREVVAGFSISPAAGGGGRAAAPLADRNLNGYIGPVAIRRFRHKGLELYFTTGSKSKIQAQHAERLRLILGRLNVAPL